MFNKLSDVGRYLILLAALVGAGSASAAVAEWKSFDEKVAKADAIIRGELVSSESRRDEDGRWIRTFATFRVEEVLKGAGAGGTVTVVIPGGVVDGIHQETVGAPSFVTGNQQIIFLENTSEGIVPLYLEQGVYDLDRDGRNQLLVRPSASNLILYDDQSGTVVPAEATRTIDDFRGQVRASLEPRREIARSSAMETESGTFTDFLAENALVLVLLSLGVLIAFVTWMRKQ